MEKEWNQCAQRRLSLTNKVKQTPGRINHCLSKYTIACVMPAVQSIFLSTWALILRLMPLPACLCETSFNGLNDPCINHRTHSCNLCSATAPAAPTFWHVFGPVTTRCISVSRGFMYDSYMPCLLSHSSASFGYTTRCFSHKKDTRMQLHKIMQGQSEHD